jgi:tRNA(Ile)-lysidine synthase
MIERVRRYMRLNGLATAGEPLWVAVSGGVDSMVLLHVLRRLGHPCQLAHVDHGLRGAESDGDRAFVEAYCAEHGIPVRTTRVDVTDALSQGKSVQMAARELRYAWFEELIAEGPVQMALAHHADDAVETLLMGLMRGMGPRSLGGIPPRRGPFIRPLLGESRAAILAYAEEHQVPFRDDSSNDDPKYLRNRVRHEVLPLLEQVRPGAMQALRRSTVLLHEAGEVLRDELSDRIADLPVEGEGLHLPFDRLQGMAAPHALLSHVLEGRGFHPDEVGRILRAGQDRNTGARFLSDTHAVHVERDELVIAPLRPAVPEWTIGSPDAVPPAAPIRFQRVVPDHGSREEPFTVLLRADRLVFPCLLRPWRAGDRMRPAGLGGSKLISDILIDAKVPRHRKAGVHVLISGGEIAWCCGHRVAEGFQWRLGDGEALKATFAPQ